MIVCPTRMYVKHVLVEVFDVQADVLVQSLFFSESVSLRGVAKANVSSNPAYEQYK